MPSPPMFIKKYAPLYFDGSFLKVLRGHIYDNLFIVHMGQFPKDGVNASFVSLKKQKKSRAFVSPNLMR